MTRFRLNPRRLSLRTMRRAPVLIAAGAALGLALGGATVAVATSASHPKTVTACVTGKRVVRAASTHSTCPRHTHKVTLNQRGPVGATGKTGPTGSTGAQGQQGEIGPQGQPGPDTGTAGGDLKGSYPNPSIADGAVTTSKFGTIPANRGSMINPDAVASGFGNDCAGDAEVKLGEADFMTPGTLYDGHVTAPVDGLYLLTANVRWAANPTGSRKLDLCAYLHHGPGPTDPIPEAFAEVPASPANHGTSESASTVIRLMRSDYVWIEAYQDSGGNVDIQPGSSSSLVWLGP